MTRPANQIAPRPNNGESRSPFAPRPRARRWGILILILWLALLLRVWQLDVLPPGLHYDEAFNGTMARQVLRGENRPIFFVQNFGEEPLHIYTEAGLFLLLGESAWAIRLVSAVFGVILVAALYACARAMFPRSDLLALAAAFLAATLYWAINFSRIGIETNGLPMLLALSAAAIGFAYRTWKWRWVVGAGLLTGLVVYTYLASRLWYVVIALWFLYLLFVHRSVVRNHFAKWVVLGLVIALTIAPLALFFLANPVALTGRSSQVLMPETIAQNVARTAGMFFLAGDTDPRDNLPGRPALDILLALFFSIGLILALRRWHKPFYAFLLLWVVVMCLPSALTEFAPNFRRAIGALPATLLLCALGFEWVWFKLGTWNFTSSNRTLRTLTRTGLVGALVISALWSAQAYFGEWARGTGLYYSFDAGILRVAQALAARPPEEDLYLTPKYDDHYTVIWALDGRELSSFDGRRALVMPNSSRASTYGIITREDSRTLDALEEHSQRIRVLQKFDDSAGAPYAALIQPLTRSDQGQFAARVGDFAALRAVELPTGALHAGDTLQVTLEWAAQKPAAQNYTVFVHLVGPPNPATNSPIWAQDDKQPGGGTFPTTQWRPGQKILETYTLRVPANAPVGKYTIESGMYLLETGERVPVLNMDGTQHVDDTLRLVEYSLR